METLKDYCLSLGKDHNVVIGGRRPKTINGVPFIIVGKYTKPLYVGRGLESKSIDVAHSAGFKTKANPTEGGKWKIFCCHWN